MLLHASVSKSLTSSLPVALAVIGDCSEGFLDYLQYPHDPNLTINVLLRLLVRRFRDLAATGVPDKLYVQLDNCGRENKNQWVLAFMALLVQEDIFKEVCAMGIYRNLPKISPPSKISPPPSLAESYCKGSLLFKSTPTPPKLD